MHTCTYIVMFHLRYFFCLTLWILRPDALELPLAMVGPVSVGCWNFHETVDQSSKASQLLGGSFHFATVDDSEILWAPVEVHNFLPRFFLKQIPGGCLGFLNHQQSHPSFLGPEIDQFLACLVVHLFAGQGANSDPVQTTKWVPHLIISN